MGFGAGLELGGIGGLIGVRRGSVIEAICCGALTGVRPMPRAIRLSLIGQFNSWARAGGLKQMRRCLS